MMKIGILSRLVRGASLSACPNPGRNMSIPIFEIEKLDPILGSDHMFKKKSLSVLCPMASAPSPETLDNVVFSQVVPIITYY